MTLPELVFFTPLAYKLGEGTTISAINPCGYLAFVPGALEKCLHQLVFDIYKLFRELGAVVVSDKRQF